MRMICFFVFILGTVIFFMGFHNIDNAWNMRGECWDTSLAGLKLTKSQLYQTGLLQIFMSFSLFFASTFISALRVNKSQQPLNFSTHN